MTATAPQRTYDDERDDFSLSNLQTSFDALRALVSLQPDATPISTTTRELVASLAALGSSPREIATVLKYDVDSLKALFAEELTRGEAIGKMSLRRAQMRSALGGNPQMLKHLGEVQLGQVPGLRVGDLDQDPADMIDPRETLKAKLDTMHARLAGDPESAGVSATSSDEPMIP